MEEYRKIQTIFHRDPSTNNKTLIEGKWSHPAFEYLADSIWIWTEKIDGTNIRVMWDGERVTFGGKTNKAQIPALLVQKLMGLFPAEKFLKLEYPPMCLYGEGYGVGIQSGGKYIQDGVDFILFDVLIDRWWLEQENVDDIAEKLGIPVVPVIRRGTLLGAYELTRIGFHSKLSDCQAEGLVMRPKVMLFDRRGERIIAKIKHKDFMQ